MPETDRNEAFGPQASVTPFAQDTNNLTLLTPPTPLSQQHEGWQQDQYQASYRQSYRPFCPPPAQYGSSQPPHVQNYRHSPYEAPDGHQMPNYHQPSMFALGPHQPRPPPAMSPPGSGDITAFLNSSWPNANVYHGGMVNFGYQHLGYQPSATGPSPFTMPSEPAGMSQNMPSGSFDGGQYGRPASGGEWMQTHRSLFSPCPPQANQHPQPYQHHHHHHQQQQQHQQQLEQHQLQLQQQQRQQQQQQQIYRNGESRRPNNEERRSTGSHTTPAHRSETDWSPRAAVRRSYERYARDNPQSTTSSEVEEAAARSPPSNRVRHRRRDSRLQPRFLSHQFRDPDEITPGQIMDFKMKLPRLLVNELPEDTSSACDICMKDYSATDVEPSEEEEVAVKLPCGHVFGEFCLGFWVCEMMPCCKLNLTCIQLQSSKKHRNKITCPMCRTQLIKPYKSTYGFGSYYQAYSDRFSPSSREAYID